jgi:hypothetical protein
MFGFLGLLFVAGAIVLVAKWIVIGALIFWTLRLLARFVNGVIEGRELERRERAALLARADQQQAWRMQGDPRGIYGEYPPIRATTGDSVRSTTSSGDTRHQAPPGRLL